MNQVILIGNLCSDPSLSVTTGEKQTSICKFMLAVNEGYGDKKQTAFLKVTVFGNAAENCDKYLIKGSKVGVVGKIQTGSYDHKDGYKVYTTDIIATQVEFLPKGNSENVGRSKTTAEDFEPEQREVPMGFEDVEDDYVPF